MTDVSNGHLADDPAYVAAASALQRNPLMPRWWLSFVDPDKAPPLKEQRPGGPSWLGVSIVRAPDFLSAVQFAHALSCNPGGAVKGFPMRADDPSPPEYEARLLTREEVDFLYQLDNASDAPEGDTTS
ncbi:hypothetical protein [Nocardia abscessus]|uniref:hypothetical protein n=1 Tax=Nocardia abscessus TaxID=120957 RepID=UPI0024569944|nr:hypothetical protein [Nocardia abscessus]